MAHSAWEHGTVERNMREIIRTFKAMQSDGHRLLAGWVSVAPAVPWVLKTAYRKRRQACQLKVVVGRGLGTLFLRGWRKVRLDGKSQKSIRSG